MSAETNQQLDELEREENSFGLDRQTPTDGKTLQAFGEDESPKSFHLPADPPTNQYVFPESDFDKDTQYFDTLNDPKRRQASPTLETKRSIEDESESHKIPVKQVAVEMYDVLMKQKFVTDGSIILPTRDTLLNENLDTVVSAFSNEQIESLMTKFKKPQPFFRRLWFDILGGIGSLLWKTESARLDLMEKYPRISTIFIGLPNNNKALIENADLLVSKLVTEVKDRLNKKPASERWGLENAAQNFNTHKTIFAKFLILANQPAGAVVNELKGLAESDKKGATILKFIKDYSIMKRAEAELKPADIVFVLQQLANNLTTAKNSTPPDDATIANLSQAISRILDGSNHRHWYTFGAKTGFDFGAVLFRGSKEGQTKNIRELAQLNSQEINHCLINSPQKRSIVLNVSKAIAQERIAAAEVAKIPEDKAKPPTVQVVETKQQILGMLGGAGSDQSQGSDQSKMTGDSVKKLGAEEQPYPAP